MRITQEADYAIRICCVLDEAGSMLGAEDIAQRVVISKSTALKVLRKLRQEGIVESHKGSEGGYLLSQSAENLTVCKVIEAIEGKISISKCLCDEHLCSKNGANKECCKMHVAFATINQALSERLSAITVKDVTDPTLSSFDIIEKVK